MKASSLFHLLQLRLRSLAPDCPTACRNELAELQRQLKVTHGRNFFELTWSYRGKEFSLSVADRDFGFHLAGDTPLAVQRRGDVAATRARNWKAAAELWRRMAEISGFAVPDEAFPDALAPPSGRPTERAARGAVAGIAGAVLAAAALAHFLAGLEAAIAVGFTAALLCCFVWTLDETHLREPLDFAGMAVLAGGTLVSLAVDWKNGGTVPLLAGIASAAWLERSGNRSAAWWAGAGLLAALGAATFGWPGTAAAVALAAALLVAAWAAPLKLARSATLAFAGAALVAAIGLAALGFRVAPDAGGEPWAGFAAWLVALGILVSFLAWWIQGSLFHVAPWLGMGALSLATVAATASGGATGGVLALSGLAALLTWRLARGFLRTTGGR